MQPTRWQILEILKRRGRATVDELSKELGITLMAVRLHLVVLERDGLASRTSVREGPGRPTLVYRLTPAAEDVFPKRYDALASALLASAKAQLSTEAFDQLLRTAADGLAQANATRPRDPELARRLEALAKREGLGDLSRVEPAEGGHFWHHYSCPYYRVAEKHREVCALHRQALAEELGAEVELVQMMLHGDGRCSFLVRERVPAGLETLAQGATA